MRKSGRAMSIASAICSRCSVVLWILISATVVVVFCAGPAFGLTAEKQNLLQNPGFEQGTAEDGPLHWDVTGTVSSVSREQWHPRTGDWAFGFGNDDGSNDTGGQIWQEVEVPGDLISTRRCFFTAWVLAESRYGGRLMLKIEFIDSEGQKLAERYQWFTGIPTAKWEQRRVWRSLPAGTKAIRATCTVEGMPSGSGSSFIWIDDLSLVLE